MDDKIKDLLTCPISEIKEGLLEQYKKGRVKVWIHILSRIFALVQIAIIYILLILPNINSIKDYSFLLSLAFMVGPPIWAISIILSIFFRNSSAAGLIDMSLRSFNWGKEQYQIIVTYDEENKFIEHKKKLEECFNKIIDILETEPTTNNLIIFIPIVGILIEDKTLHEITKIDDMFKEIKKTKLKLVTR